MALTLLAQVARLTDSTAFHPLHWLVRLGERATVENIFAAYLCYGTRGRIIVRHSAGDGVGFHALLSDMDLTAIIHDEDEAQVLVSRFKKLYRAVPFVGELEVYTAGEYEGLERLKQDPSHCIEFIRLLRKIQWVEEKRSELKDEYNAYKAGRAYGSTISRMAALALEPDKDLASILNQFFITAWGVETVERVFSLIGEVQFKSKYLGWAVNQGPMSVAAASLRVASAPAACLLAISPDAAIEAPQLKSAVERAREIPSVRRAALALLRVEQTACASLLRLGRLSPDAAEQWAAYLSKEVAKLS